MDLAPYVLTSIGIVFIMQIVTIILIVKALSSAGKRQDTSPSFSQQKNRKDKGMHNRKSQSRPAASGGQQQGASATSVDKSLREINLRLRNAERDQERARKTAQHAAPVQGDSRRDRRKGRHSDKRRQNRNNWPNRDRDQRRDENRPSENRPPQNRRPENRQPENRPPQTPPAEKKSAEIPKPEPIEAQAPAAVEPQQESLEHGRKVTVKRRVLKAEENEDAQQPAAEQPAAEPATPRQTTAGETTDSPAPAQQGKSETPQQEITFGRR
jgi:hypothetical protein